MLDRSSTRYVILLYVCDIFLTLAALNLAAWLRPYLWFGIELSDVGGRLLPEIYITTAVIWSIVLSMASAYDARRIVRASDEAKAVFVGVSQSTLILAGFLYLTFRGLSRLLFGTFYVLDLFMILVVRMGLRLVMKAIAPSPTAGIRVLIIGCNKQAQEIGQRVMSLRWMGLHLLGYIVAGNGNGSDPSLNAGVSDPAVAGRVLGQLADVPDLVRTHNVSEIIIAVPLGAHHELPEMVAGLSELPVNIKIVPDYFELAYFRSTIEDLGGLPLIGLKEPVIPASGRLVKRILDIVVAGLLLLLLWPIMLVTAILIRLDSPGPIIFRQRRVGEGERLFWMYKFRTMVQGAAEQQDSLMSRDEQGNVIFEKRPDDPRVTRLGRFLRRCSLDETPQFINVLRGEMSLVGPRPELPVIVEKYQAWQRKRFAVPPGMTGWWQVRGRSQQPMNMRTEDDLYYIQNYSLLLDVHILWKTVGAVISGRGAY